MNNQQIVGATSRQPLRLWPGVLAVVLQWLARFVVPIFAPEAVQFGVLAAFVCALAIVVWWAFFSRAPGVERWGAILLMIVAVAVTHRFVHESIATSMMGMMFFIYAIPVLSLAFVAWAVATRNLPDGPRRVSMIATILLACGSWVFLRTDGMTGEGRQFFAWRWAETSEERFLAQAGDDPEVLPPAAARVPEAGGPETGEPETGGPDPAAPDRYWPGFRGPDRDARIRGVRIETDWSASPPVELWRRPIGPGASSFAVFGDRFYTQEQRGDDEVVASYDLTTGEPVWRHRDAARFWDSHTGAGPRGTPALSDGRVYTLGATGILNALDAGTGAAVWSRDVASDTGVKVPGWGFTSSPLVVDDVVVAAAKGKLAAYDLATGEPRWLGPDGGYGYSSPHRLTIDGVEQILLMRGNSAIGVAPADGELLWEHPLPKGSSIVQPAMTADGDVLISDGEGSGMRRVDPAHGAGGWAVEERWTSNGLKPSHSDFVIHQGHAYGFDRSILSCIDVADGKRQWKGGRYGSGQLVLLADQDVLLVVSEKGELALVQATPEKFTELARFEAIEGKTWNHPVLVGDLLLIRNSQEMAAFRLPLAAGQLAQSKSLGLDSSGRISTAGKIDAVGGGSGSRAIPAALSALGGAGSVIW